jgi:hypothetical protein
MNFQEMKAKTGIVLTGIVNECNTFVSKENKEYHSVDLLVSGHKNLVNVKLPAGYDRAKLIEGQIVSLPVLVITSKFGTTINAV